jgi:hypothetical protein
MKKSINLLSFFLAFFIANNQALAQDKRLPISQPLVSDIFTADPSVHVFIGKIYIYPSHDIETGAKPDRIL